MSRTNTANHRPFPRRMFAKKEFALNGVHTQCIHLRIPSTPIGATSVQGFASSSSLGQGAVHIKSHLKAHIKNCQRDKFRMLALQCDGKIVIYCGDLEIETNALHSILQGVKDYLQ